MVTVDEIILSHAQTPYDPVKRREYYLRTRKLKGRNVGGALDVGKDRPSVSKGKGGKPTGKIDPHKAQKLRREKRKKELDAKVNALHERLDHLREVLIQLVQQAKLRSGVKPTVKATPKKKHETAGSKQKDTSSTRDTAPQKKQTTTQKREAAKRSKEYYDKNVKQLGGSGGSRSGPSKQTEIRRLEKRVEETEKMIANARKDLKASLARARQKATKTKPAVKSRQTSKKGSSQNGT